LRGKFAIFVSRLGQVIDFMPICPSTPPEQLRDTLSLTLTSDRPPRSVRAWVATAPTRDFRDAHWEAFEMQAEPQRYVHRRPMRRGHVTAIFGEAEYTADPQPFSLSTTVCLFP
jgi:PhoPQ-activated pathogenicity-related protein